MIKKINLNLKAFIMNRGDCRSTASKNYGIIIASGIVIALFALFCFLFIFRKAELPSLTNDFSLPLIARPVLFMDSIRPNNPDPSPFDESLEQKIARLQPRNHVEGYSARILKGLIAKGFVPFDYRGKRQTLPAQYLPQSPDHASDNLKISNFAVQFFTTLKTQ